jgi:hypothetical protein
LIKEAQMASKNAPDDASEKSQAEGDPWESDSETVERYDQTTGDESGGITNHPLEQEIENQASLPDRGTARDGANAGHGHRRQEEDR